MNPFKLAKKVIGVVVRTAQRLQADRQAQARHGALLAALSEQRPDSILFLCYGNICRSPFAGSLASARLGTGVSVTSAGFHEVVSRPAPDNIRRTSLQFGIDSTRHSSRRVSRAEVDDADVIFVMDHKNDRDVATLFPDAYDKTFLLGCFGSSGVEIRDPYNLDDVTTTQILREINEAVIALCDVIARSPKKDVE